MEPLPRDIEAARILLELREGGRPSLGPGRPRQGAWRNSLTGLSDAELVGVEARDLADPDSAACVRAGLLLFADDLDAAHRIAQAVSSSEGSFWHGIVHRREGDFGNAEYWFRRVGEHPVYREIVERDLPRSPGAAEALRGGRWDPFQVVRLVEECVAGRRPALQEALEELQEREMLLLLGHCFRQACGKRA